MSAPSPKWSHGDVLDVEWLCAHPPDAATLATDREKLARDVAPTPIAEAPRSELFRRWLNLRRESSATLPGATLDRIFRVARVAAWLVGIALGMTSMGGYLFYSGSKPANPFWIVLWLVAMPLLLSLAFVALARAWHDWSGPGALGRWLIGAVCRRLPGPTRTTLARHRDHHAALAVWPLLGLTQRVACGLALGALGVLMLHIIFTDIVFGWQSSVGWSAETWHAATRVIAAPWAWLFPQAVPTLEQVHASRFTYAGGVAAIDPAASRAWGAFLAGCLLVWGAGVRGLFIALIGWRQRAALRTPQFSHSDANALHRALTGPLFASESGGSHPLVSDSSGPLSSHPAGRAWLVLSGMDHQSDPAIATRAVAAILGGTVAAMHPVAIDDSATNAATLAVITSSSAPVAVLIPATRDPILAIKKTLASIAAATHGRECVVLLIGDAGRLPLWRKFAAAHRLELEILSAP